MILLLTRKQIPLLDMADPDESGSISSLKMQTFDLGDTPPYYMLLYV